MQEEKNNGITVHMVLGMGGLLLVMAGVFKLLLLVMDPISYALSGVGLAFVIQYIYTLEKKNGVSSAFQWIRSAVMIGLFLLFLTMYFVAN
ncbi:hypothetical protein [Planococcus beigongshangi]|uniref:hypothetical protein n=1 Tax=Planococcus beigongshangi TaxID=2782536 RepID=UPI00193C3572|nr:hypothetical protein [Planococcus beigongshangi]